jgi:hypothetical protein
MSAKRKKKLKEREARRNRIRRLSQDETSTTELNIQKEADYIVSRAAERDARCIVVGILVFFSTATGDAWMLDLEDRFALGLARDGVRSPARILEIEGRMAVESMATNSLP